MRGGMGNMFILQHHTIPAAGFATCRAMLVCSQQKTKKPLQKANAEKGTSQFFFRNDELINR